MLGHGVKCSKFAAGPVIEVLVAAYLAYVVLVFTIAYRLASRRANETRIRALYLSIAALVTFGPALPFLYLDMRAQAETAREQRQFEHDRLASKAWKDGLRFSPGSVRKELDRAVATIPARYLISYGAGVIEAPPNAARSDLKSKVVEQLKRPNADWTIDDLDAFKSVDADDISIDVLTTWARDRMKLVAAAAVCSRPALTRAQSDECWQTLRAAVGIWCLADAGCVELAKDESARKIIRSAGVISGR